MSAILQAALVGRVQILSAAKGGERKKVKKKREMKKERKKFYQEQKYKLITKKGFVEV